MSDEEASLFKIAFSYPDGVLTACNGVLYQDEIWLVPKWLPFPGEGYVRPERMILLAQFRHERFDPPSKGPPPFDGADYRIFDPVPRELIEGDLSKIIGTYAFLDKPDAKFRVRPKRLH